MYQQQNTVSPRNRRTRAQIESLLAEFSKSNMTVKQFCQAHCINTGTFHKWQARDKIRVLPEAESPGFAPVAVESPSAGLFAEVKGIRLYQPVSAMFLKELLA